VLQLGFVTFYMSDQMVKGLLTAAAVIVVTSQISTLLGLSKMPSIDQLFGIIYVNIEEVLRYQRG